MDRRWKYIRPVASSSAPRVFFTVDVSTRAHREGDCTVHAFDSAAVTFTRRRGRTMETQLCFSAAELWEWVRDRLRSYPGESPIFVGMDLAWELHLLDAAGELEEHWEVLQRWTAPAPLFVRLREADVPEGRRPMRLRLVCASNLARQLTLEDFVEDSRTLAGPWDRSRALATVVADWCDLIETADLGGFQPTIARQSHAALRRRIGPRDLLVHNDPTALRLERAAYVGGRCLAEPANLTDAFVVDIRSSYPATMMDHPMPGHLLGTWKRADSGPLTVRHLGEALLDREVIAEVTIEPAVPAWPVRRDDNTVIYPAEGVWSATLTSPELRTALAAGIVAEVGDVAFYARTTVFRRLMAELVELRRVLESEDRHAMALMLKVLANAVYGRTGQHRRDWETVAGIVPPEGATTWYGPHPDDHDADAECLEWRWHDGEAQCLRRGVGHESMLAVAAHVTAHGRRKLWDIMGTAQEVHYADTDGIITTRAGAERIRASTLMPPTTISGPHVARIHAPKQYHLDGRLKAAGLQRGARPLDGRTWATDRWPAWHSSAGADEPHGTIRVHRGTWTLTGAEL